MALSKDAVQKAYVVMHKLRNQFGIPSSISSFPTDLHKAPETKRVNPDLHTVYGWNRVNDGWENLVFFVKDPSPEFKEAFDKICGDVPHTAISRQYLRDPKLWIFGWF